MPRLITVALSLTLLALAPGAAAAPAPGTLIDAKWLRWYPAWYFRLGLRIAKPPDRLSVNTGATLYRLRYWTRDWNDAPVQATGLAAIPHRRPPRGIVSYQHGTTTERRGAPSRPSLEGRLIAAVFAGAGYLVLAPDYIGLGGSTAMHPYLHAKSAANAGIDLLHAGREFAQRKAIPWPSRLNLLGFSQGGHATLALLRALEVRALDVQALGQANASDSTPVPIAAAAAVGPYDLQRISFPTSLAGGGKSDAVYLGYLVRTLAAVYDESLGTVIREPYAAALPQLFDGSHDTDTIRAQLPSRPRDMFTAEFLAAFDAGEETWLGQALAANSVSGFAPRTPLKLYYGTADRDVAPAEAPAAARVMRALGGNAEAIELGPYEHQDAAVRAVGPIRAWFDGLNPRPDG